MTNPSFKLAQRFKLFALRNFKSVASQLVQKIKGQFRMTAERNMVLILRLLDQRDVDRAMNLATSKQAKGGHVRFSEDFCLVVADDQ